MSQTVDINFKGHGDAAGEADKTAAAVARIGGAASRASRETTKHTGGMKSALRDLGSVGKLVFGGLTTTASRGLSVMGSGMRVAAIGAVSLAAITGGGLAVGIKKSLSAAGDFQQVLQVFHQTAGATGRQMKQVSALAIRLGNDVKLPATSAKDAAVAMTELAKGGLSVRDAMAAARATLQLSAAAQIDNSTAAEILADSLNAFALKGKDAARVVDLLAASANATTASIPDMGLALQQSAASAHALHIPIEDVVTELGLLANAGIKSSDAGTSLKTMFSRLNPSTKAAKEEVAKLGVETFAANGHLRTQRDIIAQYSAALGKLNPQQRQAALNTIFGSDAQRAANIILDGGARAFDKLKAKTTEQGVAAKLSSAQTSGYNGAVNAFKSSVDTLAISFGTKLLPAATSALGWLTGELPRVQQVASQAFTAVSNAVEQHWPQIKATAVTVFDAVKGKIGEVKDLGSRAFDTLKEAWPGIKSTALSAFDGIKGRIEELAPAAERIFKGAVSAAETLGPIARTAFDDISGAVQTASKLIGPVADGFKGIAGSIGSQGMLAGAAAFVTLQKSIPGIKGGLAGIKETGGAVSVLKNVAKSTDAISLVGGLAAAGIVAIAQGLQSVGDKGRTASDALKSVLDAQLALSGSKLGVDRAQMNVEDAQRGVASAQANVEAAERHVNALASEHAGTAKLTAAQRDLASAYHDLSEATLTQKESDQSLAEAKAQLATKTAEAKTRASDLGKELLTLSRGATSSADKTSSLRGGISQVGVSAKQAAADLGVWSKAWDKGIDDTNRGDAAFVQAHESIKQVFTALGHKPTPLEIKVVQDDVAKGITDVGTLVADVKKADGVTAEPQVNLGGDAESRLLSVLGDISSFLSHNGDSITLYTNYVQRGSKGGAQPSAQGNRLPGNMFPAGRITRPMFSIGEEAPRHAEWVIPENPAYRGRARSLLHQAARVIGFAKGGVIGATNPDAARDAVDRAKANYERAVQTRKEATDALSQAEHETKGKQRDADIRKAQARLGKAPSAAAVKALLDKLHAAQKALDAINAYEKAQANRSTQESTAETQMDVDQGNHDEAAFNKHKQAGLDQVAAEITSTRRALRSAKGQRRIDLQARLANLLKTQQDLQNRKYDPGTKEDAAADLDLEPDDIALRIAKAQAEGDTAGELAAQQDEETYLRGLLAKGGLTAAQATDVYNQLKQTTDAETALKQGPGPTDPNQDPDLQAQLAQANARSAASQAALDLQTQFLQTAGASGDLFGGGGGLAIGRFAPVTGSADARALLASEAVAGMGAQQYTPSSRFGTGL